MSNPLLALIEKYAGPRFAEQASGLVADFWKDTPCEFPVIEVKVKDRTFRIPNILKPMPVAPQPAAPGSPPMMVKVPKVAAEPQHLWHAEPGELAEKMWGAEQVLPAGEAIMAMLTAGLELRDKNVLDLSAGLGGSLRKLLEQTSQLKGMETDAAIAVRGMSLSSKLGKAKQAPIDAYDPATFTMPGIYDCVIARELFHRVADKPKFFYSIGAGTKTQGHVVFADYIIDPENRNQPAIAAWQAQEPAAKPLGLIEMAEAWALVGFELRVSEDQTTFYRQEIVKGVNRYVSFLRQAPPSDADTKKAILAEVGKWVHRLAAIQQGMKFYRFQALKS